MSVLPAMRPCVAESRAETKETVSSSVTTHQSRLIQNSFGPTMPEQLPPTTPKHFSCMPVFLRREATSNGLERVVLLAPDTEPEDVHGLMIRNPSTRDVAFISE